jgi:hypothetical protein
MVLRSDFEVMNRRSNRFWSADLLRDDGRAVCARAGSAAARLIPAALWVYV